MKHKKLFINATENIFAIYTHECNSVVRKWIMTSRRVKICSYLFIHGMTGSGGRGAVDSHPTVLPNTTDVLWKKLSSSMYDICGGNLVYRICCCCSSFVLFHYVWHLLSPQLIISKKFFFRTPSAPSREGEMRALSDFKLFQSEREKSEHLSKNLSDSLNIYGDFVSAHWFFINVASPSNFERVLKMQFLDTRNNRSKSKRKDLFPLCDIFFICFTCLEDRNKKLGKVVAWIMLEGEQSCTRVANDVERPINGFYGSSFSRRKVQSWMRKVRLHPRFLAFIFALIHQKTVHNLR